MSQVIKIVSILVIVLVIAGGLFYVSGLRADLAVAQQNEEKLKDSIQAQTSLIESMKEDIQSIQASNQALMAQDQKHQEEIKNLSDKFNVNAKGEARDFGALAVAKPGLIERLVNRGTVNALRCLEIASGAPLTEKEINAKTISETNRECPSIANPNYVPVTP